MSIRVPFPLNLVVVGSLLTVGACATTTPPPRFTAVSPADPAAAESAVPPPAALLTGAGELAETATTAGSADAAPPATSPLLTCSMHPEVAAKEPGKCPICGMALVKKAPAPKERP